jgi:hypothetical protein
VSLRILATDEPAKEAALGLTVKVTAHGETSPTTYRIVGRRAVGGIINFSLEYQHGQ